MQEVSCVMGCVEYHGCHAALLPVQTRMGVLEQQDGAVVGVSWLTLSISLNVRPSQLNAHFQSPIDMVKCTWLETLYLLDVFCVVYEVICAVSHLKW